MGLMIEVHMYRECCRLHVNRVVIFFYSYFSVAYSFSIMNSEVGRIFRLIFSFVTHACHMRIVKT